MIKRRISTLTILGMALAIPVLAQTGSTVPTRKTGSQTAPKNPASYSFVSSDKIAPAAKSSKPVIVIGMVVDQMRWDFLYRYQDRYTEGGFKRLLREGYSCGNTMIDYMPTVTACGHACVYTGSVPAVHGIAANDWYDRRTGKQVYCTEDSTVRILGGRQGLKPMSPRNLLATTITDELRLATNFRSRTVGVALKDRGAILPAGHAANGAFWCEGGEFVSSTYYMDSLPDWVNRFNARKLSAQYIAKDWETLYPISTYTQSTADDQPYEGYSSSRPVFPHHNKDAGAVRSTPFGNTLTFDFARAAIEGYGLGGSNGEMPDFLAVSFSSTDVIGHQYGPNSIETEDAYLRLDRDLAAFLDWLDKRYGRNNYLFFITADHGVDASPGFLAEHKFPTGALDDKVLKSLINEALYKKFGIENGILSLEELQIYINRSAFEKKQISAAETDRFLIDLLKQEPGIAQVVPMDALANAALPEPMKTMLINGYNPGRSSDLVIIPQPGWVSGEMKGANHGNWNPYDAHIPLVWMGWNIHPGETNRVVHMTDIAPTLAALLHIQMPSGCVGSPITEVVRGR